jgi:hypothetical protein
MPKALLWLAPSRRDASNFPVDAGEPVTNSTWCNPEANASINREPSALRANVQACGRVRQASIRAHIPMFEENNAHAASVDHGVFLKILKQLTEAGQSPLARGLWMFLNQRLPAIGANVCPWHTRSLKFLQKSSS